MTTAISRLKDLEQFDDNPAIDTWSKSGRNPGPGEPPVSWEENEGWLLERIRRGDDFGLATDPRELPPASGGYIPGEPNGYFTGRELQVLQSHGIEVSPMY